MTDWLWTYGCGHKVPTSEHTPLGKTLTPAPCPVCGVVSVPGTQVPDHGNDHAVASAVYPDSHVTDPSLAASS